MRYKIGIMFGNPETTTGGEALKFYASVRLDIRKKEKIEKDKNFIGNNVIIKVVKNKVGSPFKQVNTCIMFGKGIYKEAELLEYNVQHGNITKAGPSWFKYKELNIQGVDKMIEYIKEHFSEFEIKK